MWKILLFLGAGMLIGGFVNLSDPLKKANSKCQHFGVILLLFVMGASIGIDHDLLTQFQTLGFKASIFAILTTFFSIAIVYAMTKFLVKGEHS